MSQLDNASLLTIDKSNMLGSVASLADQVKDAWAATEKMARPVIQGKIDSVVVFGMGGSGLGTHVIQTAFRHVLKVPIEVINDYAIPASVNDRTLVVFSSYSGDTEETLFVTRLAMQKTKHVAVIAAGGLLADLITVQGVMGYLIDPKFNPCGQPRMAIGYSVFGLLGLLERFGLIDISQVQIDAVYARIQQVIETCNPAIPTAQNPAKQMVEKLNGKFVWVFASEHLVGNAHLLSNQLNENGKCLASYYALPEANHHLMESLVFPGQLVKQVVALSFVSKSYHPRNQARYPVTGAVMRHSGIDWHEVHVPPASLLEECGWVMAFGEFISVYSALLYGVDPSPIPKVDFFKEQLAKVK